MPRGVCYFDGLDDPHVFRLERVTSGGGCPVCGSVEWGEVPAFAVTGGRHFDDFDAVHDALDRLSRKHPRFVLVHGACSGADTLARRWKEAYLYGHEDPYPADWDRHGNAAGPIRNRQMARSGLDGLIAFPGGRGTANMIKECRAAGVPVWRPMG